MLARTLKLSLALLTCTLVASDLRPRAAEVPAGMVAIPGGIFKPLFRSSTDPSEINVPPFLLDVCPVTNEEFLRFIRANPRWRRSAVKRLFADETYLKTWSGDLELGT